MSEEVAENRRYKLMTVLIPMSAILCPCALSSFFGDSDGLWNAVDEDHSVRLRQFLEYLIRRLRVVNAKAEDRDLCRYRISNVVQQLTGEFDGFSEISVC